MYFNPSNTFRVGDHLHAFVFAETYGRSGAGVSAPPGGRGRRLAWDGTAFAVRLSGLSGPGRGATCVPVTGVRATLASVPRDGDGFLAVTPAVVDGTSRIWVQRSPDLFAWSASELLVEVPLLWSRDCDAVAVYGYPALLAPKSGSRNFETARGRGVG